MASSGSAGAWLALLLTASSLAHADPTPADKETARTFMDEGRELRDKRDLRGALDRFQRADAIMRVPPTGYELARTQVALGLLVEARDTIAHLLLEPAGPQQPPQFRTAHDNAQALDDALAGRIPALTVEVRGARPFETPVVTIDGVQVPAAVLGAPRRVNPGHHLLTAKTATSAGQAEVDVKERETLDVRIVLQAVATEALEPAVPNTASRDVPPPSAGGRSHVVTYVGFGVAVVGVAVGSVAGILTLSKKSSLDSECNKSSQCPPSAYGDVDGANTLATVSTVAFIGAGVGAAVGAVSLLLGGSRKTEAHAPEVSIGPWFGVGAGGVRGRF